MNNLLTRAYISMKNRALAFKESFKNDERGVGPLVATILILVVVIIIAAVFWDRLSEWVNKMLNKIFKNDTINNMSGSDIG